MKIEIDLDEILEGEFGSKENLAESIHRQVVTNLQSTLEKGIKEKIDAEVAILINEQVKSVVTSQMPSLIDELMNAEYRQVSQWGDVQRETTTVRKELVKAIQSQMQYKPAPYRSDSNMFTQTVNSAVEALVKEFKKDFDTKVVELFQKEAFDYAVNKMAERLGLPPVKN